MSAAALHPYTVNKLLNGLPSSELQHLLPYLEPIPLPHNKTLFEARDVIEYAYFPTSGLVSLLGTTRTGDIIGIALVGNEGMIGAPLILRTEVIDRKSVV